MDTYAAEWTHLHGVAAGGCRLRPGAAARDLRQLRAGPLLIAYSYRSTAPARARTRTFGDSPGGKEWRHVRRIDIFMAIVALFVETPSKRRAVYTKPTRGGVRRILLFHSRRLNVQRPSLSSYALVAILQRRPSSDDVVAARLLVDAQHLRAAPR